MTVPKTEESITGVFPINNNLDWFIFVCRGGCVQLAQEWFESWTKCECYYPVAKKYVYPKKARADAPGLVQKPALGSYLFARFYEEVQWGHIREQNSHVLQWVKVFQKNDDDNEGVRIPATVRNDRIEALRRCEVRGDFDDVTPDQKDCTLSKILKGQIVHIPYGPFYGAEGATLECVKRKFVKIKVTLIGQDTLLTFPFYDIFPEWDR